MSSTSFSVKGESEKAALSEGNMHIHFFAGNHQCLI